MSDYIEIQQATFLRKKAKNLSNKGEIQEANILLKKLLKIFLKNKKWEQYIYVQNEISTNYLELMEFDKSLNLIEETLKISIDRFGISHLITLNCFYQKGKYFLFINNFQLALDFFYKVLEGRLLSNLPQKHELIGQVYFSLGRTYTQLLDLKTAFKYINEAIIITRQVLGEESNQMAHCYLNLGNIFYHEHKFEKALKTYKKALDIWLVLHPKVNTYTANFYNNIASTYYHQKKYKMAISSHQKALDIRIRYLGESHPEAAHSYKNIGQCYERIGSQELALEFYEKALLIKINTLGIKNIETAEHYNTIAGYYQDQEDYFVALKYYQQALKGLCPHFNNDDIYENPNLDYYTDSAHLLITLYNKAACFYYIYFTKKKDFKYLIQSFEIFKKTAFFIIKIRQNYRIEESKLLYAPELKLVCEKVVELGWVLFEVKQESKYRKEMFKFSEHAKNILLLESIIRDDILRKSKIPKSILIEKKQLWRKMIQIERLIGKEQNKNNKSLQDAHFEVWKKYNDILSKLQSYYNDSLPKIISIKDIQEALSFNSAFVEWCVTEDFIFIFIITQQNFEVKRVQKDVGFEEYVDDVKDFFSSRNVNDENRNKIEVESAYIKSAYKLYKLLFGQIKQLLQNINNLIIISDGELSSIPFEALVEPTNERDLKKVTYLIQKYSISHHYSATLWLYNQSKSFSDEVSNELNVFLGIAPINFSKLETKKIILECENGIARMRSNTNEEVLGDLPSTEEEIEQAFELFKETGVKAKALMYGAASKKEFMEVADKYKVILISTHGHKAAKSKLSGIVFSKVSSKQNEVFKKSDETIRSNNDVSTEWEDDNVLTIDEVYTLQLNADLVVLSSCSSGIGELVKGEGMMAMNRAFLRAGAKNILYTVYDIADEPSKELVCSFFVANLKEDMSYSKALQRAKMKSIEQGIDPYYWASFVLIANN